jgi:hypothetical protein
MSAQVRGEPDCQYDESSLRLSQVSQLRHAAAGYSASVGIEQLKSVRASRPGVQDGPTSQATYSSRMVTTRPARTLRTPTKKADQAVFFCGPRLLFCTRIHVQFASRRYCVIQITLLYSR